MTPHDRPGIHPFPVRPLTAEPEAARAARLAMWAQIIHDRRRRARRGALAMLIFGLLLIAGVLLFAR